MLGVRAGGRDHRDLRIGSTKESTMTAPIRLAASEGEVRPGLDGAAIGLDEAPVGLPEEAEADTGPLHESRRDAMLGEAPSPLVAQPENRAGGRSNGRERCNEALARLIAFVGPRKVKVAPLIMQAESAEAKPEDGADVPRDGRERQKSALARL